MYSNPVLHHLLPTRIIYLYIFFLCSSSVLFRWRLYLECLCVPWRFSLVTKGINEVSCVLRSVLQLLLKETKHRIQRPTTEPDFNLNSAGITALSLSRMLNPHKMQENFYWEIDINPKSLSYHFRSTACFISTICAQLSWIFNLMLQQEAEHLSTWFPCPLWMMFSTSGVSDQCQRASKNLASFDAQPHCLHPPRNILFLASGATRETAERFIHSWEHKRCSKSP